MRDAVYADPSLAAWHALGRFYLTQERFREAGEQFTRALQAPPPHAALYSDQGVALMEQHKAMLAEAPSGWQVRSFSIFGRRYAAKNSVPPSQRSFFCSRAN